VIDEEVERDHKKEIGDQGEEKGYYMKNHMKKEDTQE